MREKIKRTLVMLELWENILAFKSGVVYNFL